MLSEDIEKRILMDFGMKANLVSSLLLKFIHELNGQDIFETSRVLRCVIHLGNGNIDDLQKQINKALIDYRDVIYWAEYDKEDKKIYNFSEPFQF